MALFVTLIFLFHVNPILFWFFLRSQSKCLFACPDRGWKGWNTKTDVFWLGYFFTDPGYSPKNLLTMPKLFSAR